MPIEPHNLQKNLSPKEVVCLSWFAQGKTIQETALLMGKRYSTIRSYLERIKVSYRQRELVSWYIWQLRRELFKINLSCHELILWHGVVLGFSL